MWCRICRIMQYVGFIFVSAFLCNGIIYNPLAAADKVEKAPDSSIQAAVSENHGKLPLSFEVNNGQVDEAVKFLSRGNGYTFYLTSGEAVLSLKRTSEAKNDRPVLESPQPVESHQVEREVIRLKNIGANPNPKIIGLEEMPGKSNYFIGNDPSKWQTDVSNYGIVRVQDIYPGIDLVYYGNRRQLEFDWIVSPSVDPDVIRFAVESKAEVTIDSQGNLLLDEKDELRLNKPLIYQERDGDRAEITGQYVLLDKREVGIEVSRYDRTLPLVIDPVLSYSTYLGGSGADAGSGIAVDAFGNAYITGGTYSLDFPIANPFQASNSGGADTFIAKLNSTGEALLYSTYLGGSGNGRGLDIAVDTLGNAYVTGETESTDFPTENPFQASSGGSKDAFAAALNANGDALVYGTYIGGDSYDVGTGIAVDSSGNAYVTGAAGRVGFPAVNPFQAGFGGGGYDAFVIKITAVNEFFFPEIAVGAGWSTTFKLFNTGDMSTSGYLYLYNQQGNELYVNGSGLGTNSLFPISIQPGGSMFLTVTPYNPVGPALHGWARAEFWGGTLRGVATYQFESEGFVTALAGVLPAQPIQFATIPVDDKVSEARTTAYAIANPGDANLWIKLKFPGGGDSIWLSPLKIA